MRRLAFIALLVACGVEIGDPPPVADDGKGDGIGMGGGTGSGSGSGSGGGAMALSATNFLTKISIQYCDESFRCKATYPPGSTAFANDFGSNAALCYAGAIAFYGPQLVEQSITAGRVLYDEGAATQCLAGIKYPTDCNTFWQTDPTFPNACGTALVGTIANDQTCTTTFDCIDANADCDATTKKCTL